MASQIKFFRKSWCDFGRGAATVTASQGQDLAQNILDRSNLTLWGTSGSVDADNTTVEINAGDIGTIDSMFLMKHNFKNFRIQYWDEIGLAWSDFATPIAPTNNTQESNFYSFPSIQTSKILITIYGTMVANADKYLAQFVMTSLMGQLSGWPQIKKPVLSKNIIEQKMLSGKSKILQNVGFFGCTLDVANWNSDADLTIVEALYNSSEGFLVWLCGGDESQFSSVRRGYRFEDLFLMRCKDEFAPEWANGFYTSGLKLSIDLIEVNE